MSSVNDGGEWTADESKRLVYLRQNHMKFQDIAEELQGHTADDCKAQYETYLRHWRPEEESSKPEMEIAVDEYQRNGLLRTDGEGDLAREQSVAGSSARHPSTGKYNRRSTSPTPSFSPLSQPSVWRASFGIHFPSTNPSMSTISELSDDQNFARVKNRNRRRKQKEHNAKLTDDQLGRRNSDISLTRENLKDRNTILCRIVPGLSKFSSISRGTCILLLIKNSTDTVKIYLTILC